MLDVNCLPSLSFLLTAPNKHTCLKGIKSHSVLLSWFSFELFGFVTQSNSSRALTADYLKKLAVVLVSLPGLKCGFDCHYQVLIDLILPSGLDANHKRWLVYEHLLHNVYHGCQKYWCYRCSSGLKQNRFPASFSQLCFERDWWVINWRNMTGYVG